MGSAFWKLATGYHDFGLNCCLPIDHRDLCSGERSMLIVLTNNS